MSSENQQMAISSVDDEQLAEAHYYAATFAYDIMYKIHLAANKEPDTEPGIIDFVKALKTGLQRSGRTRSIIELSSVFMDYATANKAPCTLEQAAIWYPEVCVDLAEAFADALIRASEDRELDYTDNMVQSDPENLKLASVFEALKARNMAILLTPPKAVYH